MDNKEIARSLREWMLEDGHYSVVHFAIEAGMSKEELFARGGEDEDLRKAIEYAMSVQEGKVADMAMKGEIDRNVAMKMLDTYSGWKGGLVNIDNRRVDMSSEVAERLIDAIDRVGRVRLAKCDQDGVE